MPTTPLPTTERPATTCRMGRRQRWISVDPILSLAWRKACGGRTQSLPKADLTHNARVSPNGPFSPGELVMLLDPDGKRFLMRLNEHDSLHHHQGAVRHV